VRRGTLPPFGWPFSNPRGGRMNMLHNLPAMIRRRPGRAAAVATAVAVVIAMVPAATSLAASAPSSVKPNAAGAREALPNFDARSDGNVKKVLAARAAQIAANPTAGVRALRKSLGVQGIVQVDALTKTPRRVAKVNGFLTLESSKSPKSIALTYVRL